MKKYQIILFLFAAVLSFASCKKKEDTEPKYFVKFKVEGSQKFVSGGIGDVSTSYYKDQKTIQLLGRLSAKEGIELNITNFKGKGTYTVSDFLGVYAASTSPFDNSFMGTYIGTITISSFSETEIKGTFSFTGESISLGKKVISEGSFSSPIILL